MRGNKERVKGFVIGFVACAMLSTTMLVTANTGGVMREVFYGVNINLNGQVLQLADIDRPFIMDGRTFLPVRAISEALEIPVDWDGSTRTVFVGTIPHGAPFWTTVPPFERERINIRTVNMQGQSYANAITANSTGGWSRHNLNAQFNTITGVLGRIDGGVGGTDVAGNTPSISFVGDGRELASFNLDFHTAPQEISVDVTGVLILQIQITQPWLVMGGAEPINVAFANVMIY